MQAEYNLQLQVWGWQAGKQKGIHNVFNAMELEVSYTVSKPFLS